MARQSSGSIAAAVVLAASAHACSDRSPSAAPSPLPPPEPVLSRIRVEGPAQIEPGTDAQFTVWARFDDGTETDVTAKARLTETGVGCYECDETPILRIGESGVVHAVAVGEAGLYASYTHGQREAVDGHHRVLVLPAGTFKLSGRVTEADSGGLSASYVEVQVDSETGRLRTHATANGEYRVFGVRGATLVAVVSDYHESLQHRLVVDGHLELNLQIRPIIVRANEAFTLVLEAADDCAPPGVPGALPDAARQRRYTATLTTTKDDRVFVRLTGADFATYPLDGGGTGGNGFVGQRITGGLFFGIRGYYNDGEGLSYPDILERLSLSQFLTLEGATTISGGSRMSGALDGTVAVYDVDLRPGPGGWWQPRQPIASCTSAHHEFILQKR
jgi:hypothetical protein